MWPAVGREVEYRDKNERLNLLAIEREDSLPKHVDVMQKHKYLVPKHVDVMTKHVDAMPK